MRVAQPQQNDRTQTGPARFVDPHALMQIRNLPLRARVVVEGLYSGLHRSPYHGFSVEFSEYRQYSPGDDPKYLDWKLFARSDRYYIKRFEEETNLRCYLLLDLSRSMGYGSTGYSKVEYARTAAATLAWFFAAQRDAVGLVTFDEKIADYLPARYRPGHLHRLMLSLERAVAGESTNLAEPLGHIATTIRKRGMVILISDLLAPIEALRTNLGYLRSQGHEVVIFRTLDPAEIDFPFAKPAQFYDVESGRDLYVDPTAARSEYLRRFNEHAEALAQLCRGLGVEQFRCTTTQPLESLLLEFVRARLHARRSLARPGRGSNRRPS